jgi:hypothetical protein
VPPGILATFSIDQRLEFSDNPDFDEEGGSDLFGRTILGFGLNSETRVQRFGLNLGLDIEEGRAGAPSVDVANPFAQLVYDRNTRNATISAFTAYRESDVDSDIGDEEFDLDGDILRQEDGTRESLNFRLSGEVGRDAPIGGSWSWDYNEITFSDTTDPDLTDQSRYTLAGQVDFRITPRIVANVRASYSDFDARGNGTDRETTRIGTGVALTISPVLTANLGLGYDRIERSGDETGTDDGLSVRAGLERAVPNGAWQLDFSSAVESNEDGRRSNLTVGRSVELPRSVLNVSFGLSGSDIVGTDPLLNVDYSQTLPRARINLGLSQSITTDSDNDEQINTRLRAGFDQQINALSQVGLSLSLFDVNDLSTGNDDTQRIDVSLTYRYALTRDWGLVGGVSHRRLTEENEANRSRNTIFIGLRRDFAWIP